MTERMAAGILQADGSARWSRAWTWPVAQAVAAMARLPLDANVQFMTIMATNMPFVGRGWGGSPQALRASPQGGAAADRQSRIRAARWRGACSGAMSNSIAPSLRAWGFFSAQPGRASGRESVPDSGGRRRSAWSSRDSSFRPAHLGATRGRAHVLADVDAHVRGDASTRVAKNTRSPGRRFCLFLMASPSVRCWRAVRGSSRPAISRKTCRTRPLQSKPSEASSPPRIGVPMASRPACTRSRRRGDGGFLRQAQAMRLARAWVAVDSEAWAAPGIQDRVSARRGWTAGRQGGEGRFGLFA